MINAKNTRAAARELLRGYWLLAILVGIVAALLGGSLVTHPDIITLKFDVEEGAFLQLGENYLIPLAFLTSYALLLSLVSLIYSIVILIIGGAVQLGHAQFYLKLTDGDKPVFDDLFSQLHRIGAGFILSFLTVLYTLLWSFLFIIPGIMAAYSYAMAPYILAENPHLTPNQAIAASKEMMQGHRWNLFLLDFSFIGWHILSVLTLGLGYFILGPYQCTARTIFYRELCERLHNETSANMPQMSDIYQENTAETSYQENTVGIEDNWYDTKNPYEDEIE